MTRQISCVADASMRRGVVPVPAFPFGNELVPGTGIADGIRGLRSQNDPFPAPIRILEIVDIYCNSRVPGVPLLR